MKTTPIISAFTLGLIIIFNQQVFSQCSTSQIVGQNLVKNGDFSQGNVGFTHDPAYIDFTPCGSGCYSAPGKLYVGSLASNFNNGAFTNFPDHSPSADNMMLMVDGLCTLGMDIWRQTVTVMPSTNYYFIYLASTLDAASPAGSLQININGVSYTGLTIPSGAANIGVWTPSTVQWTSCATCTSATISIQNTETSGCNNAVDFVLDDISISAGCLANGAGPVPNLGPNRTLCAGNTTITLTSGIAYTTNLRYAWSTGATTSTLVVNTPGTYSLCVDSALGGGNYTCKKSSIVTITNSYSINLNGPYSLCSPSSYLLNTGFTGPGVTYLWSKNGSPIIPTQTTSSYLVTSAGNYGVTVVDLVCGTQTGSATVTSSASTPVNATICFPGTATLSISGSGKYKWYNTAGPTGGTVLGTGPTLNVTNSGTYYAADTSSFAITVGPSVTGNNFTNQQGNGNGDTGSRLYFSAIQSFRIDTIYVYYNNYYCPSPGGATDKVGVDILNSSGAPMVGSPFIVSVPCTIQNNGYLPAPLAKIPIGLTIPQGNGYTIKTSSVGGLNSILKFLNENDNGGVAPPVRLYNFPTTYSNVVTFVSNSTTDYSLYYKPDAYPGYLNWKITVGTPCDRVPVQATNYCPLSLFFLDVSAYNKNNATIINWQTTKPSVGTTFTIEKSRDGNIFTEIGTELDNADGSSIYSFTDLQPAAGINYYRIKSNGPDGLSLSNIVSVNTEASISIAVFPNPFSDKTSIRTYAKGQFNLNYSITDVSGRLTSTGTISSNGEFAIGEGFHPGVYVLTIESPDGNQFYRILKE